MSNILGNLRTYNEKSVITSKARINLHNQVWDVPPQQGSWYCDHKQYSICKSGQVCGEDVRETEGGEDRGRCQKAECEVSSQQHNCCQVMQDARLTRHNITQKLHRLFFRNAEKFADAFKDRTDILQDLNKKIK